MRILQTLAALALTALAVSSCASAPLAYTNPHPGEPVTVAVWLDPHAGLPAAETLEGCNRWKAKDVVCVMARNRLEADVSIIADDHPCGQEKDGSMPVAFASPYRVISFRIACYYDTARVSGFDRDMYLATLAHEMGHELGIWEHVPLKCTDKVPPADASGVRRCGVAIMNPMYDPDVQFITPVDALAFDMRSRDYTVAPRRVEAGDETDKDADASHSCVMYAPAR